eukprot:RCo002601
MAEVNSCAISSCPTEASTHHTNVPEGPQCPSSPSMSPSKLVELGRMGLSMTRDGLQSLHSGTHAGFRLAEKGARAGFRIGRWMARQPGDSLSWVVGFQDFIRKVDTTMDLAEEVTLGAMKCAENATSIGLSTSDKVLKAMGVEEGELFRQLNKIHYSALKLSRVQQALELLQKLKLDVVPNVGFFRCEEDLEVDIQKPAPGLRAGTLLLRRPPSERSELWRELISGFRTDKYSTFMARHQQSLNPEVGRQIRLDLPRTFPVHPRFNTDEKLAVLDNVLRAYAFDDPEVGYCQGMNFVAGLLLLYLTPEEALDALVMLMRHCGMRDMFAPGMPGIHVRVWQFEKLLEMELPAVYKHLREVGLPTVLFCTSWFLTAFVYEYPTHFCARVFDVLLAERSLAIVFKTAIELIRHVADTLLLTSEMEELVVLLKRKLPALPLAELHGCLCEAVERATPSSGDLEILEATFPASFAVGSTRRVEVSPVPSGSGEGSTGSVAPSPQPLDGGRVLPQSPSAAEELLNEGLLELEQADGKRAELQSYGMQLAQPPGAELSVPSAVSSSATDELVSSLLQEVGMRAAPPVPQPCPRGSPREELGTSEPQNPPGGNSSLESCDEAFGLSSQRPTRCATAESAAGVSLVGREATPP